ncbi:MAG: ATP-binding protein [Cyclobacteriaceae bacterium]
MDFSNEEIKGRPTTMILWKKYKQHILNTCLENNEGHRDMAYWRNFLFVTTLSFMVPLSLIALIPSLYISYLKELYALVIFDLVAVFSLVVIAHVPGISLDLRKWIFIGITYGLGIILIYFLGNLGPGLLFLLAISIFMILVFPVKYAFTSVYINLVTCSLIGVWIYTIEPHQAPIQNTIGLESWIAISSNLIFLGAVFSLLIPKLLNGLQDSMEEQSKLKNKLSKQKRKLKQSLKELEEKNTELEHFAYVASHDLQEPLRMVTGFLQLLETKYINQLDEKARSYIKFSMDGAIRMRQLILDLLEYSRLNKSFEHPEEVQLENIIAEVKKTYLTEIKKTGTKIIENNLPIIYSHPRFLVQVFQNLVGNAIKYSQKGLAPKIEISCRERPNDWLLSVKDNGIGLDPSYSDKIFIIFQRLHTRDQFSGTGIGLAIVKKIVEYHGGKIWVDSEEGKGSTFFFTLPKTQTAST